MSVFRNKLTGKMISFSNDKSSFIERRLKMGIDAMQRIKLEGGLSFYFNTIDLSNENIEVCNKDLNRFHQFLRQRFMRQGLPFQFLWVKEIQMKRYYKYGVKVPHWHEIYLCPSGSFPDCEFRQDIKPHYKVKEDGIIISQKDLHQFWGFGQNFCERAYTDDLWEYLGKYLSKGLLDEKLSHLIGMSHFGYYKSSKSVYDKVQDFIKSDKYTVIDIVKRKGQVYIIGVDNETYSRKSIRILPDWEIICY